MDTEVQRAIRTIKQSGKAKAAAVQLLDTLEGVDVMHIFARRWLDVPAEHVARAFVRVTGGGTQGTREAALRWAWNLVRAIEEVDTDPLAPMHYAPLGFTDIACGDTSALKATSTPSLVTCPACAETLEEPGDAINGGFPSVQGLARVAQPDPGPPTAFLPSPDLTDVGEAMVARIEPGRRRVSLRTPTQQGTGHANYHLDLAPRAWQSLLAALGLPAEVTGQRLYEAFQALPIERRRVRAFTGPAGSNYVAFGRLT